MKRFYGILTLLTLVLVLVSFNVNGQNNRGEISVPDYATNGNTVCNIYDVSIEITGVQWDTQGNIPGVEYEMINSGESQRLDDGYHAVYIEFNRPANFHTDYTTATYTCNISANLFGVNDKPVVYIFEDGPDANVDGIYNDAGELQGFEVYPYNPDVGGISTTVGVMGRVGNVSNTSNPCVQVIATNRRGDSCNLPNRMYVHCGYSTATTKMAQAVEQDIRTYPNPAQNNIFVETNDLDVTQVNVMSLYGQALNDKVSIRYGIDRIQVNTTQLESGIYLIVLETLSGSIVKKVMIQRD